MEVGETSHPTTASLHLLKLTPFAQGQTPQVCFNNTDPLGEVVSIHVNTFKVEPPCPGGWGVEGL